MSSKHHHKSRAMENTPRDQGNKLDRHNLQVPICVGDSTTTNLYFAGEACHYTWSGTAHGAIDSGKKVALQIMEDYNLI